MPFDFPEPLLISCGGVLFNEDRTRVCILHKVKTNEYVLPKGKQEQGESLVDAAAREIFEETGFQCFIPENSSPIAMSVRRLPTSGFKLIYWFVADLAHGTTERDQVENTQMPYENFEHFWLDYNAAMEKLSDGRDIVQLAFHRISPTSYVRPSNIQFVDFENFSNKTHTDASCLAPTIFFNETSL